MALCGLYKVTWEELGEVDGDIARQLLDGFQDSGGTYTLDLQELESSIKENPPASEARPAIDLLRKALADGQSHSFDLF